MVPKVCIDNCSHYFGFGTILFDMVPKDTLIMPFFVKSFGTILFDMVPKGVGYTGMPKFRFGTVRFITTLNTFSVFYFHQNMAYYYYE